MHTPEHTASLGAVNARILAPGQSLPAVRLRDGSTVQTGTVAAMLANIAKYNAGERGQVERELEMSVPTLVKVGLFELFQPMEWVQGNNEGLAFVGQIAAAYLQSNSDAA